jgi:hypothetical protein
VVPFDRRRFCRVGSHAATMQDDARSHVPEMTHELLNNPADIAGARVGEAACPVSM